MQTVSSDSIQFEGSRNALWIIVQTLGDDLLTVIPTCPEHFLGPLRQTDVGPQALVNALQVN